MEGDYVKKKVRTGAGFNESCQERIIRKPKKISGKDSRTFKTLANVQIEGEKTRQRFSSTRIQICISLSDRTLIYIYPRYIQTSV